MERGLVGQLQNKLELLTKALWDLWCSYQYLLIFTLSKPEVAFNEHSKRFPSTLKMCMCLLFTEYCLQEGCSMHFSRSTVLKDA